VKFMVDTTILAPIEVVFEAVTKDEEIKKWNELFVENIYESEEQRDRNEPGTTYTTVIKAGKNKTVSYEGVLVEYKAPHLTTVRVDSKEGVQTLSYRCEPLDVKTTRVSIEFEIVPSNFYYKLMAWATKGLNKMLYKVQFDALKEYLEEKGSRYERSYGYLKKQAKFSNLPFWYDAGEKEKNPPLSDEFLQLAEEKLQVKLPESYIQLLKVQNGGYLVYDSHPTAVPTSWAEDHIYIDELFGITFSPYETSIIESPELIEEWGLPKELILISGDGHSWVALDYRRVKENPPVIYIDLEQEKIIELAPNFDVLLEGLTVWDKQEE
jgi:uncharacterized protein YndB with AHSA1/START domain